MAMSNELKKIKKVYGENFMKLCRSLFPTILEQEGRLYEILSSTFSENCKTLYEDLVNQGLESQFKDYIYSQIDVEDSQKRIITKKTPYELLEEAGYDLIECLTEEDIQKFKKYYAPNEALCTFNGGRLERCVVFWAIKKNVEDIKREDFKNPKREDEYGTSVMGIQFNREGLCTVSIKNRYNHTVNNPDATYGNDLDRITPGLIKSFSTLLKEKYDLELNSTNIENFEILGYTVANDGKYYKYNMEINGNYYCPGNIVITQGREAISVANPEEGLLIDYFYIDKKNKTIETCANIKDSFVDGLQEIEKIDVVKSEDENVNRLIKVYLEDVEEPVLIGIDKNNQIVKYENKNITDTAYNFLFRNKGLTKLELPNLIEAGDVFLTYNKGLTELELPNLTEAGYGFLTYNEGLTKLELPNLIETGEYFLENNQGLTKLELPNLTEAGDGFLTYNEGLTKLELPNLTEAGNGFLKFNQGLTELELPNLTKAGSYFLLRNRGITKLELPNLTEAGDCFLQCNEGLTELELPNLTETGNFFLSGNEGLTELELPNAPEETKKRLLYIIERNIRAQEFKNKEIITAKDIAQLDKENELTTSEVSLAHRIIEKIKKFIQKKKDDRENEI